MIIEDARNDPQDDSPDGPYAQWKRMHDAKAGALEQFNQAKFGLFIHWGVYSQLGGVWQGEQMEEGGVGPSVAEWIMRRKSISRTEYAQVAAQFNPVKFNADEWAQIAADAGMRYMVLTAKHNDGFALFDSKQSEWDIMDASPFKRDVIQELDDACAANDIRFGVYYSHTLDWWDGGDLGRSSYLEGEATGLSAIAPNDWDPSPRSFQDYFENKAKRQVEELAKRFPDLFVLWFDGGGYLPESNSLELYRSVYRHAPTTLINSRISNDDLPRHLGDYQSARDNHIPEQEDIDSAYWETCATLNNSWGYKRYDHDWKSPIEVLSWLVDTVSRGGNYLLNVGPTGEGKIPEESVEILRKVGDWLSVNGDAVYGTRAWTTFREGPTALAHKGTEHRQSIGFKTAFTPQDLWFTKKGKAVYAIALVYPDDGNLLIRSMVDFRVDNVQLLGSKQAVTWETTCEGLSVTLPEKPSASCGYALEVRCDTAPE